MFMSGIKSRIFVATAAIVLIALFAGLTPRVAYAQPKTCGISGTPSCPGAPPTPTPFRYDIEQLTAYGYFDSLDEAGAAAQILFAPSGACSFLYTGSPGIIGTPATTYGFQTNVWHQLNFSEVVYEPQCNQQGSIGAVSVATRNVTCPVGEPLSFQAGPPVVGPTCTPQSNTVLEFKASGNPCAGGAGSNGLTKGNPCDVANGNKYEAQTDYSGVGSNPLQFTRSYNSFMAFYVGNTAQYGISQQPIGVGWTGTYFQRLTPVSVTDSMGTRTAVHAFRPDGRVLTFNLFAGVYNGDPDVPDELVAIAGGYQYHTVDDTLETYSATGQLLSIASKGHSPVTVSYDSGGLLPASVTDGFGHVLRFTYIRDSAGNKRLQTINDPAGGVITYTQNSSGNLTTVSYPDLTTRIYGYGSSSLLQTLTDESSVVFATWGYTYFGVPGYLVTSSTHAGGAESYSFGYSGSTRTVTDPLGTSRTYTQSLISGLYHPTGSTQFCLACGEDHSRSYDGNGNVVTRTDFNGNQSTYLYDLNRNLESSRTEAAGTPQARTITTLWDPTWRLPDLITEPNRTTGFTYDSMGNVLTKTITDTSVTPNAARTWTYTYDGYGRVLTADGPRTDVADTTTYSYYTCTTGYQCGQIYTITDALGHITTFNTYNAHGQPLTITDPNGVVTTLSYDARMRLLSRQVGSETTIYSYYPTGLLKQVTLPDTSFILYTYDAAHRLTQISDALGNFIQYTLDAMGNRTAEKVFDPSSTLRRTHTRVINALNEDSKEINAAGTAAVTTTLAYDNNGNLASSAAPLSRNTTNQYDALNHIKQITDPNAGITKFTYDGNANLQTVIDPRNLTTTYTHNGFGEVTQLVSPDTGTSSSTYDSGGNLKTATDARSAVATYSYDALNRVSQVAYSDQTINFTYDAGTNGVGRLTGASDANHSLSWTYDTLGRVTGKGQVNGVIAQSVGYGYTNGDLVSLVTPSGQTVTYTYSNHRVSSVAVNGTTILSSVTYDPFGPAIGWTWGNATTVSRVFDQDGNPSQIVTAGATNGYTIDNASRISGLTDSGLASNNFTFGYDLLDRVTNGTSTAITCGYTYDANSNQLTTTGTVAFTDSVSATNNRLSSTSGGLARTYAYDAAGNTLSYAGNVYTFNQRGRMSSVTIGTNETDYIYNALGQLIRKSGAGGTTLLMYDEAGHILGEYTASGGQIQETIWMGDLPIATIQPNGGSVAIYYVHTDHLGTPRKITNPSSNTVVWRWDPDTSGSLGPTITTITYNLRFPGMYSLPESGLFYNYYRTYDPQTGRYIESDPAGLNGGINTYAYVGGNPITGIDPLGLKDTAPGYVYPTFPYWPGTPENTALGNLLTQVGNNILDNALNAERGGGNATTPAPYSHPEENEALAFSPDPFGGKEGCERLAYAIKVLRAQLNWRKTDLNFDSKGYVGHLQRTAIIEKALKKLEEAHRNICGGDCPQ
jgi:RHS repeat-associated protein